MRKPTPYMGKWIHVEVIEVSEINMYHGIAVIKDADGAELTRKACEKPEYQRTTEEAERQATAEGINIIIHKQW
ncbi:hypothetical protein Q8G38_00670 [Halomonas venusta]|uniref:hypothetical protein n=1 Tax=Vreelandella venusta TaxID=44935 RepID=UPI00295E708E|nr:hypothetical protein [Halomonas venusta]MDW0357822.1 hypothetical protein [Halomonas venusta]